VDTTFGPRLFSTRRLSQVLLVAVLILAVLAALLFYAGSQQHKLPPPFGPARNGIILSSGDGNISVVDPQTSSRRILVTNGFGAGFSRDGTKFFFLRGGPSPCGKPDCGLYLMVANTDGSGLHPATPDPIPSLDWADWSPDGSKIAFLTADTVNGFGRVLGVVNADGTNLWIDPAHRHVYPSGWMPPNGDEIMVRQEHVGPGDPQVGVYAVRLDGTRRPLTTRPATSDGDYAAPTISSDGHLLAYTDDNIPAHEHIIDLRTGADSVLPGASAQFDGSFSPDGKLIAYLRAVDGDLFQLAVAPVDGSNDGRLIGKAVPAGFSDVGPSINNFSWSADGTAILANFTGERIARLIPIDGGPMIDIDHGDVALPNMQRLAP
jgi:Tol biopolymer transport system component